MLYNIRPIQTKPIPWGWVNREIDGRPVVEKPRGEIRMPDLINHFDWENFEVSRRVNWLCNGSGASHMASYDMKSVFTTTVRFLGFEETFVRMAENTLDISPVFNGLYAWNIRLMRLMRGVVDYLVMGDDIADNRGLMFSDAHFAQYILPGLFEFCALAHACGAKFVYHSDGDISSILDSLDGIGVDHVVYQPVGELSSVPTRHKGLKMHVNDISMEHQGYPVQEGQ